MFDQTDEELEDNMLDQESSEAMPVIENMKSYMVSVYLFEECQDTIGIDDSKYEILSVIPF